MMTASSTTASSSGESSTIEVELAPFPIDALRGGLELAWAMTVHKSQGSEFGQVAVMLPEADLPIVSRELVYTALTRARGSAVVVGDAGVLGDGGARKAVRSTGTAKTKKGDCRSRRLLPQRNRAMARTTRPRSSRRQPDAG
jgi:hypothetical protein